jgi:hypothetical protein
LAPKSQSAPTEDSFIAELKAKQKTGKRKPSDFKKS